jgi:glycosyltransferase involved in cell wall biosynthesis
MRNTMKALHRRGVAVDVVTTDDDGDTQRLEVPLDQFMQLHGQRVRYFPRQTLKYAASYPLLRWLRRHVSDYDIVHTHGLFSFAPLAAAWHARSSGVPYIMRPAGVLDTWGMKNKSRIIKATSVRMVEGPLLRSAAAVHFMTRLEQTRASELPLSICPVVLPLGFEFDTSAVEDRSGIDDVNIGAKRAILYLARIHPIKCVDTLLRAFASLPERTSTVLVIAGDGDPQLVGSLKRLSQELGLEDQVQWVGFATGARKRSLLSLATLFVLPSASENFGVAVVEAMNAGLPVVVTRGCGLAEFVSRARAGLVTDGSVESLRAALSQMLADDDLRRVMGTAGRQAVSRELSLDAFGNRLELLYRNILADHNAHATAAASPGLRL